MILAKVLNNASNEVPSLLASKLALQFLGSVDLEAMSKIASAAKAKSLESFRKVVSNIFLIILQKYRF